MCGIIGVVSPSPAASARLDLQSIRHRGPDAQAMRAVDGALLGHARLSIIALETGAQPMSDVGGRATIVFNGEIYNYRELRAELTAAGQQFATGSDTEVILGVYLAWGLPGFARLRGMYAFAIADHLKGQVIVARDPFGIKPLFYHEEGYSLYFASEQGALVRMLERTPAIDATSVLETLAFRYPFGEHTLYQGIRRLQPGTALVIEPGRKAAIRQFSSVVELVEAARREAAASDPESVFARVGDSVAHHAIADVPLGCFLSGGLDSSIVAERLAHGMGDGRLRAYSVGFASTRSEQSELSYARAVAEAIGADLHPVTVDGGDFADLAPRLSGTPNGPFPDPADIAMLKLSLTAAQDVKVVLSGEGSDEAFAGYPKYAFERLASPIGPLLALAHPLVGRRGKLGIVADAFAAPDRIARWLRWFRNDAPPARLIAALLDMGAEPGRAHDWAQARVASYPRAWTNMQRMQVLDLESWLPNNLLHRGDYTTMQASLEQRVPFLDIALTPWAVAQPDAVKIRGLRGKRALRGAFASRLPEAVLKRPKSGFRLPLGDWLVGDPRLRQFAHDMLLGANGHLRAMIGGQAVEAILAPQALSSVGGAKLAWTALCLELWLGSGLAVAPLCRR